MREEIKWLYKPANLEAKDYENEIKNLLNSIVPDLDIEKSPHFLPITDHAKFKEHCPTLFNKISDWGLGNRLAELAFIVIPPGGNFPIHRDYPKWEFRNLGLLFPVINCHNSYTAFYETEVVKETLGGIVGDNAYANRAQRVDENNVKEITRIPNDAAYWVNVFTPHKPIVEHNEYRVTFSIRFRPELFDIIQSGYFDENMVK